MGELPASAADRSVGSRDGRDGGCAGEHRAGDGGLSNGHGQPRACRSDWHLLTSRPGHPGRTLALHRCRIRLLAVVCTDVLIACQPAVGSWIRHCHDDRLRRTGLLDLDARLDSWAAQLAWPSGWWGELDQPALELARLDRVDRSAPGVGGACPPGGRRRDPSCAFGLFAGFGGCPQDVAGRSGPLVAATAIGTLAARTRIRQRGSAGRPTGGRHRR